MCNCDFGIGTRTCHCVLCHETFASPNGYDWHLRYMFPYGPVCLAPELILRKDGSRVLFPDSQGHWREHRPDRPNPWPKIRAAKEDASRGS